jgi:hypothetical protein
MKRNFEPFRLILILLLVLALCGCLPPARAATWYVRTDGGTSVQCTGQTDAAYPGKGTAQACAFNNPQWAIPPGFKNDGVKPPLLQAGDTLQIAAGVYPVGYGTPGATACQANYAYNCIYDPEWNRPLPSGITIMGDCSNPTTLYGTGHQYDILNLTGSSGVTVKCLELTDHSTCIDGTFAGIPSCGNSATDTSVQDGIDIRGAANVTLANLNIHGLAHNGILAGALTGTTTVTDVTIRANAESGWNGDLGGTKGSSSNSGTLNFTGDVIARNGCTEAYPATTIVGCRGADQGGYGDGLGTALTGGNWTFKNSTFAYNTSDGLDLLYADGTGTVMVDHVTAAYNASQQVKVSGNATIQNSVIIGQCDSAKLSGAGLTTLCRAAGNAVEMDFTAANQAQTFAFNTVTGDGDCLIDNGPGSANPNYVPGSSNAITISNSILLGQVSYLPKNSGGTTCAFYSDGTPAVTWTNSIVWNTRNTDFTTPGMINKDPLLQDESLPTFNPTPLPGSPAIGTGTGAQP